MFDNSWHRYRNKRIPNCAKFIRMSYAAGK